jgi:hypothetical protein
MSAIEKCLLILKDRAENLSEFGEVRSCERLRTIHAFELRDQPIAARVHTLYLRPVDLVEEPKQTTILGHMLRFLRLKKRPKLPQLPIIWTKQEAIKKLVRKLSALTSLKEVYLDYHFGDTWRVKSSLHIVEATWMAVGHNLRELTLRAHLEVFDHVLCPLPVFERLEALSISLYHACTSRCAYSDEDEVVMSCVILVSLIESHGHTLRSLTLIHVGDDHGSEISSLMLTLGYLPHLTRLEVCGSRYDSIRASGLRHILALHPHLITFYIREYNPADLDCEIRLPLLKSLIWNHVISGWESRSCFSNSVIRWRPSLWGSIPIFSLMSFLPLSSSSLQCASFAYCPSNSTI